MKRVRVVIPRNWHDPLGTDARERRAIQDFKARFVRIRKGAQEIFKAIPYTSFVLNAGAYSSNRTYNYELDDDRQQRITAQIQAMVDDILLEGGRADLWFNDAYVTPAYVQGTAMTYTNIAVQSKLYAATKPSFEALIASPAYRRRINLLAGRQFEQMSGFATDIAKDKLAGILVRGMIAGNNPRIIADRINDQMGIEYKRALRIARTEINSALRTARADEAKDAQERLGIRTKMMHLSALSPTTRDTHAERHGELFTIQEEMDWLSQDGNSINCKCSMAEVVLDRNGIPYDTDILERTKAAREAFISKRVAEAEEKAKKKAL